MRKTIVPIATPQQAVAISLISTPLHRVVLVAYELHQICRQFNMPLGFYDIIVEDLVVPRPYIIVVRLGNLIKNDHPTLENRVTHNPFVYIFIGVRDDSATVCRFPTPFLPFRRGISVPHFPNLLPNLCHRVISQFRIRRFLPRFPEKK